MQIKLLAVFAFILLFLIIILVRLVYINVKSGNRYAKEVLSQENYDSQTLYSRRGEIHDTNGRLLAYSEKVYNIVLDCNVLNQYEDADKESEEYIGPTISALYEVYGFDREELRDKITNEKTRGSRYQVLKEDVPESVKDAFEEYLEPREIPDGADEAEEAAIKAFNSELQHVKGIWFEEQFIRRYPMNSLASNVIGFSNTQGDGICGLESYYDSQLKGTNGRVFGYLNQKQEYQKKTIAPENGYTLQTTIDVNIQQMVEKHIADFDETYGEDHDDGTSKHGAKDIGVIVMDPNTGGIKAMAGNSSFDLNDPFDLSAWYTESEEKAMTEEERVNAMNAMWSNYCVSDGIEPGSTFKPITIASALECGAVTTGSSFTCDGIELVTDTKIRCDAYPNAHGVQSLGDVLKNSCNDGLMAIGAQMRVSRFIKYQSLFNFGKPTGIDLPNESAGSVYSREMMNEVELATCTFGQGLTCTMVQEIAAFSAVINGGRYYQPHVVDKILDEDGNVIRDSSTLLLKQTVSSDVSEILRGYLETAVLEGTGKKAQVPGYRVGGKTGTAEKIDPNTKRRADGKYLVSFIGAVPINDPQVVIYVVVDEPNVANQANSSYAQYLYQAIATEVLPYMGIYPTENVDAALLAQLGLTQEDLASDVVHIFQAYDSNHVLHQDARVKDGKVVDAEGNEILGAHISSDGTVYDAYSNAVSSVEVTGEPVIDPKAENPDIALPPSENNEDAQNTTTWDATVTDEDIALSQQ